MNAGDNKRGLEPKTEMQVLSEARAQIVKALGPSFKIMAVFEKSMTPQIDAILKVQAFAAKQAEFAVEIKSTLAMRDLMSAIEKIKKMASQISKLTEPMIVSRYLSKPAQELLTKSGVSFADATGNFRITSRNTGMFLMSDAGAKSDPWRKRGRPKDSISGNSAAKVVRALIDKTPPYSIAELIRLARSSSSTAYRIVEYLEQEALLEREGTLITKIDWQNLVRRWSEDYSYWKNNSVLRFLDPRGIDSTIKKIKTYSNFEYAITGSVAADKYAPYAESKQLTMYAKFPIELANKLELVPVENGANVFISATAFDVVFERTREQNGLILAAPSQITVDLLTGPGRNPEEAQALIEWMEKNERKWRENS